MFGYGFQIISWLVLRAFHFVPLWSNFFNFSIVISGPNGGLTFPMRGFSTFWFESLFDGVGVIDIWGAFGRSIRLGLVVMVLTVILSLMAGMAFRKRFLISSFLFYATISSLIVPSIVISLGVALEFRIVDDAIKAFGDYMGLQWVIDDFRTTMGLFTSGLGAQLTWTLPFGLLIMFAVFNRFDPSYEEAARDLGAGPWQTFSRGRIANHCTIFDWRCSIWFYT